MVRYNFKDLIGQKFGRLTVIKRVENSKNGSTRWLCRCECGNEKIVLSSHLKSHKIQSCGCLFKEKLIQRNLIHGKTNTKIFKVWQGIKNRCFNKNSDKYIYYGGRGISICQEWQEFLPFYNWAINNGYKDNLTIDHINVNGDYEPSNCRWVTVKEQANNKQNTVYITYNGETHTIPEWSRITKINKRTLYTRYYRDNKIGEDLFKNA